MKYQDWVNCDIKMVGDEWSRKPYALATAQGSPIRDQMNDAYEEDLTFYL